MRASERQWRCLNIPNSGGPLGAPKIETVAAKLMQTEVYFQNGDTVRRGGWVIKITSLLKTYPDKVFGQFGLVIIV